MRQAGGSPALAGSLLGASLMVLAIGIVVVIIASIVMLVAPGRTRQRVFTPQERRYLEAVAAQATEAARPPAPAGYAFNGARAGAMLVFCVDPVGGPALAPPLLEQARAALDLWQTATSGSIPLSISGQCPGAGVSQGGGNVIGWGHISGGAIGWAKRVYGSSVIDGGDIALEPAWPRATEPACTVSTITHELGHMIGLDHQQGDGQSIMFPYNQCRPVLADRDAAAARHLYP